MRDVTDLVTLARTGDSDALEALVVALQEDIWRFQLSRARNEADAEDATQETFAHLVSSIGTVRDPRAFAGWLYRIALNKATDVARRRAAEERATAALAGTASTSTKPTEEEAMERSELGNAVRSAVARLEETLRTTVQLRYEHGLAYADIARAMDCPEGTVADRLHTAHEKLKRALAGAGVAVALAAMQAELSAAPAAPMPERVASRIRGLARGSRRERAGGSGPRKAWMAAAALVLAVAVGFLIREMRRSPETGSASDASAAGRGPSGNADSSRSAAAVEPPRNPGTRTTPPAEPSSTMGIFCGRVLDRDTGAPIAGARIFVLPGENGPQKPAVARATAAADGSFELEVAPGDWRIDVTAPGYVGWETAKEYALDKAALDRETPDSEPEGGARSLYLDAGWIVPVAAGVRTTREVSLFRGTSVTGEVVDESGAPLAGASVRVAGIQVKFRNGSVGLGRGGEPVPVDSQGRFRIDGLLPVGTAALQAMKPGYRHGSASVDLHEWPQEVRLTMRAIPVVPIVDIAGKVTGPDGLPVTGVVILASGGPSNEAERRLGVLKSGPGADGSFLLEAVPADTAWVVAWAPGLGISVASPAKAPGGRLEMSLPAAGTTVRGRVIDGNGNAIAGAHVAVASLSVPVQGDRISLAFTVGSLASIDDKDIGGFMPDEARASSAVTGADGSFTLEKVFLPEGGRVEICASADGFDLGYAEVEKFEYVEIRMERSEDE